jgi:hypothetical protein
LSKWDGLFVFDQNDPTQEIVRYKYDLPTSGKPREYTDFVYNGNTSYLGTTNAALILNTTSMKEIKAITFLSTISTPNQLEIIDQELYLVKYSGISVYNITEGTDPVLLQNYSSDHSIDRFDIEGNYIYAIGNYDGIEVINRTDPSSLQNTSFFKKSAMLMDLQVLGDQLFVADRTNGLHLYSILDNRSLQYQTTFDHRQIRDLDVIGDDLVAVDDFNVSVYHIGDGSLTMLASQEIDNIDTEIQFTTQIYDPESVHVDGETIYVTQGYNGIAIYSTDSSASTFTSSESSSSSTATTPSNTASTAPDRSNETPSLPIPVLGILTSLLMMPILRKFKRS